MYKHSGTLLLYSDNFQLARYALIEQEMPGSKLTLLSTGNTILGYDRIE